MRKLKRLAVYCGSSEGTDPAFMACARDVGAQLARWGIAIVYGGGCVGMMGAVADGALSAGGEVIGASYARMIDTARRLGLELHVPKWLAPPTDWM